MAIAATNYYVVLKSPSGYVQPFLGCTELPEIVQLTKAGVVYRDEFVSQTVPVEAEANSSGTPLIPTGATVPFAHGDSQKHEPPRQHDELVNFWKFTIGAGLYYVPLENVLDMGPTAPVALAEG